MYRSHHRHSIRATLATAVVALVTMCVVAAPAGAKARSTGSYAPHIDKRIVSLRADYLGPQLATWYGPGFYGNGTACGQTLQPDTWGIAHRTLPCGTLVTLSHKGKRVTVRVIDRGPYSGATVDLTARTKQYLGFASGTVRMAKVTQFRLWRPSTAR